ncbi:MAG: hypothetical protein NVS1B4_07860 [Gemmatimonadaceae bacterium]
MTGRVVRPSLIVPATMSAVFHVGVAVVVVALRVPTRSIPAPIYTVNIVAAPPGRQQVGVVAPPVSQPEPPPAVPLPTRAEKVASTPAPPRASRRERKPPPAATPSIAPPSKTRAPPAVHPRAGGGDEGGRGADVASVHTEGIEFPFPGYLNNIVRQIALNFHPGTRNAALRADLAFLIHRDGSVSNVRFVTRSGVYGFDLEAQGALEVAKRNFGPLPEGFRDDVLPVTFSFDPRIIR